MNIHSSAASIGSYAFSGCCRLASITIPSSEASHGKDAFFSCFELASITIPSSLASIGDGVFTGCSPLNEIIIISCIEKRIEYVHDQFLIYKSDASSDTYDTLLWCTPTANSITIPSFIKIIVKN